MTKQTKKEFSKVFLGLGLLAVLILNKNFNDAHASLRVLLDEGSIEKRKIAFVHVGKTGGTTLRNEIAATCFRRGGSCKRNENIANEMEISKQIQDYYHTRKPDARKFSSFIVTIRDPIDRIVSWFLYQHPENEIYPSQRTAKKLWHCYREIDDLATKGLSPIDKDKNLTAQDKECMKLAAGAFSGKKNYYMFSHLAFNYEFYMGEVLQDRGNEIFTLRTENFWDDWQKINSMLGGGEIRKVESFTHYKKDPAVYNRTLSCVGMKNLCNALCSEIKIYEQIIERAVNIEEDEKVLIKMNITKKCPDISC